MRNTETCADMVNGSRKEEQELLNMHSCECWGWVGWWRNRGGGYCHRVHAWTMSRESPETHASQGFPWIRSDPFFPAKFVYFPA